MQMLDYPNLVFIAFQSMSEAIVIVDDKEVVQFINNSACQLLSIQADKVVGKSFPYTPNLGFTGNSAIAGWFDRVDNRLLDFGVTRLLENGKYVGTLIVVRDKTPEITASKLLEIFLNDIRAAIVMIGGFSDMLLSDTDGPLTDDQRELVSLIKKNVDFVFKLGEDTTEKCRKVAAGD